MHPKMYVSKTTFTTLPSSTKPHFRSQRENKGEKRANSSTKLKAKVISTTAKKKKHMSKTKQKC